MNHAQAQREIPLEGPVSEVDVLPRLAAQLGREEWSGQLVVRSADVERRIYFLDGNVQTATSSDEGESLAAWLVSAGLVDATAMEQAAAHLGTQDYGLAFVRKLVDLGMLGSEQVLDAEEQRVVALAEGVLSLRNGIYRCVTDGPPAEMISHAFDVPRLVATAVLGRWEPTWAMNVLGAMGSVLKFNTERLPEHEATGADEAYDLTLLRVDGQSTLAEVVQASPLPELAAVRFLAACRLLGIVEPSRTAAARAERPAGRPVPPPDAAVVEAPPAEAVDEPSPDASPEPAAPHEGDSTVPGFYRPSASAPAPRAEEPVMNEPAPNSGLGRWLAIALILGLLGAVAWFGWVGLRTMSDAPVSDSPAREAAP